MAGEAGLEITDLAVHYGPVRALRGIRVTVPRGAVVAVLGANGAGKTTLLRAVSGTLRFHRGGVTSGTVSFGGSRLNGSPAAAVARGVVQVPEGRRVFARMTVAENLRAGALGVRDRAKVAEARDRVHSLFPILAERPHQRAGLLSGGEQQMLSMARALATNPAVLLIDELSMGLAPIVVEELYQHVRNIVREGLSIVIVEQFAHEILGVADIAGIRLHGRIQQVGSPAEIAEELVGAYLGADGPDSH
jgi:branched-chain amino acid transport system ATP-binding protein